jgi:hypothetical protein
VLREPASNGKRSESLPDFVHQHSRARCNEYPWDEFESYDERGKKLLHVLDNDARLREIAPKLRDTLLYAAQELAAFKPDDSPAAISS